MSWPALLLLFAVAEPGTLVVCGEEGAALEAFAAALAPVRLETKPGACLGVARVPRLRLIGADGVTQVVLERPGEAAKTRRVPWLDGEHGALETLATLGRLGSLAVLVHGLLAERATPASAEDPTPAGTAGARVEPAPVGTPRHETGGADPAVLVQRRGAESTTAVAAAPLHEAELAPVPEPPEAGAEVASSSLDRMAPNPTTIATQISVGQTSKETLEPAMLAGVRVRRGSAPAVTVVAAAARGSLAGRLLFESAAAFDLAGRSVEHEGAGVGARFVPRLATLGPVSIDASIGADLVLLALARTELGSERHLAIEPVAAAGFGGRVAVAPWLALVLQAEAAASLAPPLVKVPAGPETALGALGGRLLAGLEFR